MVNKIGTISWGDGDNHGTVIGGGNSGNIYIGASSQPQPYERGKIRLLPITERGLQTCSALVSVIVFLTGYQTVAQLWGVVNKLIHPAEGGLSQLTFNSAWTLAFAGSLLMVAMLLGLLRIVRHRTHHYSRISLLPGLAGVRDRKGVRRLALIRNRGLCTVCGGNLRFYSKAIQSHKEYNPNTRSWRTVVDLREPVAECVRNPRGHWWTLDPADTDDLDLGTTD